MVHKVKRDDAETAVAQDQKANQGDRARRGRDHRENLAQLERLDTKVLTVRLVRKVTKVSSVHKGSRAKASRECKAQLEGQDPRVRRALDHKASKGNAGAKVAPDAVVRLAHKVAKVREHKVRLAKAAPKDGRALMVHRGCKEKACRAQSVRRASMVRKVRKEQVCKAQSVRKASLEYKAFREISDHKEFLGLRREALQAVSQSSTPLSI